METHSADVVPWVLYDLQMRAGPHLLCISTDYTMVKKDKAASMHALWHAIEAFKSHRMEAALSSKYQYSR
jgi:hypothetical protein